MAMQQQPSCSSPSSSSSSSTTTANRRRSEFLNMIKSAACLNSASAKGTAGKGRSKLSSNKWAHGYHLVKGKSGHDMEDYHVAEHRYERGHELGLYAIFDGHLGDSVPSYLKDNLFTNILREPNFWRDPEAAIRNAYQSTDQFILENSTRLGPGGSTAVTAIVIDGRELWIANLGDSRAVVCERGAANQLSVDHEPDMERHRIEKQGGFVTLLPGDVPRVNGQLAVARAFGDQSLKAHLSSEPHVRHVPLDPTMEFVILASDGLWKVMKNQEAVDLVKSIKDPQAAAKRLTTEALARKSKDDISCIVIRFRCQNVRAVPSS
uniref:protein-serine/threonine phosphatase n=1 Tax=Anthurium amnicola TaxID=1678845 RepID=A0A1D1ZBZ8_9ARAE